MVNALKDLASLGCTVLCTIHQPSSEVFHLFDRVLLLADGRTFYDGRVDHMAQYLLTCGYPVPPETNPADHVMFLMQTLEKQVLQGISNQFEVARKGFDPHAQAQSEAGRGGMPLHKLKRSQAPWMVQFMALGRRDIQSVLRDTGSLMARYGSTVMLTLIFSLIFYKIGDSTDTQSHFGALANLAISGMFGASQPVILLFPSERPRFLREYATGTYGAIPYFWSKLVTELPLTFSTSIITFLVAYWLEALKGNFILHVLILWLIGMAASSTALVAGCIASNVQVAMQAAPAIFVPQILFAGFFIKIQQIPVWIRWAKYLCSLKVGINLFLLNEFNLGCPEGSSQRASCMSVITQNDIKPGDWWVYGLVLIGIFFLFRSLALILLMRRAKGFALA